MVFLLAINQVKLRVIVFLLKAPELSNSNPNQCASSNYSRPSKRYAHAAKVSIKEGYQHTSNQASWNNLAIFLIF